VPFPTLLTRFAKAPSGARKLRSKLRVGIPRILNLWSTHQFWLGFLAALGIEPASIVFSSETSEEQHREFGKGRGTVDCCYPVKCATGHYGQLMLGMPKGIDILRSPMIYSLPSFLHGHVVDSLACPRVMAAPENIRSGFTKERDLFADRGIRYVSPLVALAEPALAARQLHQALKDVLYELTLDETEAAVVEGYRTLERFNQKLRDGARGILTGCALENRPCILVLARPYHMDPGIGHEIDVDLQSCGYPVLWSQYLPIDRDWLDWLFATDLDARTIRSAFDIADVWPSSYSANTNELLWAAKVAARVPWISCVIRLASYECGMDQPTYTPVQRIVESSGTLFFAFQDLDATKPSGGVRIRVETIAHYLAQHSPSIIERKSAAAAAACPLLR
jgi:predicted nucleotide-binding protein (sugar kinase/HSP70/actin superfamily)